ncbi:MAG: cyclic nucleotide-binding protein, partial [Mucilaginibacter sp.]|nr:cyclic nucleotide-binding protein [Mucilaginibacter sp.]
MQLQLKYNEHTNQKVSAAFLPGVSPADWFKEMQLWHINLQTVRCFIMPRSIAVNEGAGLFVIFHEKHAPAAQSIQYPYSMLAGKLFVPLKSTLYPVIGNDELKTLLLWELQVFHPFIGLVGFEKKDEIKLSSLIAIPQPKQNNWHMAHPGLIQPQGLRMIALEPEEFADVLDNIKEDVGRKPLDEIPDITAGERSKLQGNIKAILKGLTMIALFLLMVLGFIGKVLFFMLYTIFPSAKPVGNSQRKGWLQQLENWVNRKIDDLNKQRDSELKRLMDMFDSDSDEALKYAIPLDSPYLNRGEAPKSGKLNRRNSLDFNLSRLGGGGRVDSWNIGDYHAKLRAKYQQSAREAVERGDFKRAAYIHAHLLGDFYSASSVLQQGKLYREAAALYKDHLKNNRMAAECLEKGGLLTEAIPLYIEMDYPEKVG